jgi:redox-sensitive bicupin YhaK (pirin superfamily)
MENLKMSEVIKTSFSGDFSFSVRKIRANQFNDLMAPFMGFDHFQYTSDVFGPHPHPEMSSIRYLFDDSVSYYTVDSIGTNAEVNPGSLLWTWAGRGVMDTEFPIPSGGRVHGLQLFSNRPASGNQQSPQGLYIDYSSIPELAEDGVKVRVVSGKTGSVTNLVETPEPMTYLHLFLSPGKTFRHHLPAGWNGTIYAITGNIRFTNATDHCQLDAGNVVSVGLSEKEEILTFTATEASQLILLSGLPSGEAVFSSGRDTKVSGTPSAEQMDEMIEESEPGPFYSGQEAKDILKL